MNIPLDLTLLARIDLLILDVDGVLTDGKIILTPGGDEIKEFHVRDGAGMKYWRQAGKKLAVITGRGSPAVSRRLADLGVDAYRMQAADKVPALRSVLAELNIAADRAAVIGDDLPDLPLLKTCALPIAVADAVPELHEAAKYITKLPGGHGAVREAIEMILRPTGHWAKIVERYSQIL